LRIDFIITELFVGGAERCLTQLALGLSQRGEKVRVATIGSLPQLGQTKFVDQLRDAGIELFSAECDHASQLFRAKTRLRDWLRSEPADVVQTMLFHANVVGTLAASAAGVKVRIGGIRVAEPSRWRAFVEAQMMKRMSAVVCVSDSVREFVKTSHRTRTPLHVIGNGIDIDEVDALPKTEADGSSAPTLLFVGRLHAQKGLDVLFEALPALLKSHPEMRVAIVGDGPLRDWVEASAMALDAERIAVLGWCADALAMIARCRMLVLPSRFEGMPNVVLEAMAAGKPVAVTRVEGVAELLRDVADTQTCEAENAEALRQLISRLWSDPTGASELGKRNRQLIVEHHSLEAMIDGYQRLYRDLANRNSLPK
jgi:glycosyltransferase involved in cell wall biosynthesis